MKRKLIYILVVCAVVGTAIFGGVLHIASNMQESYSTTPNGGQSS